MNSEYNKVQVGLIGTGLEAYWSQFQGLEERLAGYLSVVENRLSGPRRVIHNFGLVDTPEKAQHAAYACRRENIELLLVYVTTYTLSAVVLPIIRRAGVPVLILNIQPDAALDCGRVNRMPTRTAMTGEWLAYCSACAVPEIANVMRRLRIDFRQLTGVLEDDSSCWAQAEQWLNAAEVVHTLSVCRLGLMGHYYSGMLDIATDLLLVSGRFGLHIEMVETDELSALRLAVDCEAAAQQTAKFREFFDVDAACSVDELMQSARTSIALDQLVKNKNLDLLAYYYKGSGVAANEETMNSIILGASMLTGHHVPIAGEYEVKNVIAMKILDLLGVGGSFTEYYGVDFAEDLVLMGHDGPAHVGIAQGRIRVRPLKEFHGKVGSGLSVEMSVQYGPVTVLSLVEDCECGFMLLTAQGESVEGEILEIGNTNSRYRFPPGARGFLEGWNSHGPAHHCAIGRGHIADQLEKVAWLLGMRCVQVC
jgi:L-arabinose isomerase